MAAGPTVVHFDERPPDPDQSPGEAAAIVVVHGMGQQRRHATMSTVVQGLGKAGVRLRSAGMGPDKTPTPRAETHVDGREVHVYEAWWAPLAASKANLREVLAFLWGAGTRGIRNALGRYRRHTFNEPQETSYRRGRTAAGYVAALLVVTAAVALNAVGAAVLGALLARRQVAVDPAGWPGLARFEALTAMLFLLLAACVACGALLAAARRAQRRLRHGKGSARAARAWSGAGMLAFFLLMGVTIAVAAASVLLLVLEPARSPAFSWVPNQVGSLVAVWTLFAVATWYARSFLVRYVGDVAAYVGGTGPNRLGATRQAILAQVTDQVRHVFDARSEDNAFLYGRVVVVGHSLGSVIAYDAVNAVLGEDEAAGRPRRVVARGALVTFGSPLDKLAFLYGFYRTRKSERKIVAEAVPSEASTEAVPRLPPEKDQTIEMYLAMAESPLILKPRYRDLPWVNVHARADIVSGSLELYDGHALGPDQLVRNEEDETATTPLMAHNEYWHNAKLYEEIRRLLALPVKAPLHADEGPMEQIQL